MRTALILLSFLIFAFVTSPLPILADASPDPVLDIFPSIISSLPVIADDEPVLDINGEELRAGQQYYILSVFRPGGGLSLHRRGNEECRLDVVQRVFGDGLPVTLEPVNGTKGDDDVVRVSTNLNFKFNNAATTCDQSTVWKLDYCFDEALGQWFVTTGGVDGNPGPATTSNWFKIEKFDRNNYKIVFCPSVCHFGKLVCRDVGLFHDDGGVRRLALTGVPFGVVFRKVSDAY